MKIKILISEQKRRTTTRVILISGFYQMFQSLKQFLEDYVPKKRHAKFQAGWSPFTYHFARKVVF
jgi:hypothetical protein